MEVWKELGYGGWTSCKSDLGGRELVFLKEGWFDVGLGVGFGVWVWDLGLVHSLGASV